MASLNHGVSFSTVSIQPLIKNIGKRIQEGQRKSIEALSRRTPLAAKYKNGGRRCLGMRTQGPTSAISTWSESGKKQMSSALPTFVPVLGDLVTLLNQNLVKREASRTFTLLERQTLGMIHRVIFGFSKIFMASMCRTRRVHSRTPIQTSVCCPSAL